MSIDGPNPLLLLPGIFRTLDVDNSGSIEAVEIQPFVTEVVTAVAKLASSLLNEFENDLKSAFLYSLVEVKQITKLC
jgi:hypothetical protein